MRETHQSAAPPKSGESKASLLVIYEQKLASRRRLAKVDPTNLQWRCSAAELLKLIGNEYQRAGLPERAIQAQQESCAMLRELVDLDPRNRELQRHLSISLGRLARTKLETGDLSGALAHQEESLVISRKLRSRRSSRADRMADAETLASVADLRFEVGDDEGALAAYEELLPIERELLTYDPSDAHLRWNLSCTLHRVGDLQLFLGDPQAALLAYEESLAILRSLIDLADSHEPHQDNVCLLLKKIGDLKLDTGEIEPALAL